MSVPSDEALERLGRQLGEGLLARGWRVATAESCTGGWIAKVLTDSPGSSLWFGWGFVTYADEAKGDMLHVPNKIFEQYGAVSREVARAMAQGARNASAAQLTVAVSGIAGPGGGTADKPVGTVWFGWTEPGGVHTERRHFDGDREAVRRQSVAHALELLLGVLDESPRSDG